MATYVSPSQLDTYLTCKRKWGFRYLDGIEAPPHRSAKVGTRVHEILETWLRDATPPVIDEKMVIDNHEYFPGRIAMEAIPFLPPPGPHLTLEQEFRNKHWLGYKDVRYRAAENHVVVMDHKTTSDLGWAKTPEDLAIDPQAIIYAKSEFDADPQVQIVDLAWTYMKTSKPYKARPVRLRVLREYVDEAIRPYDYLATEMLNLRNGGYRASQLEPDSQHCQKYGGCPYLDRCNLTSQELMRGVMNQLPLMEKIAAAKAAAAGAPLPPALPSPIGAAAAPPVIPTLTVPALPESPPALPTASAAPAPPLPTAPPALPAAPPPLPTGTMAPPPGTTQTSVLPGGSVVHHVGAPPLPAAPEERWLPHPEDATYEFNTLTNALRKVAPPPAPAANPAPPPIPAAAPVPPAEQWFVHPDNPGYEYNSAGQYRPRAAAATPALNPPETPKDEKAQLTPVTPSDADESKVGDQYDAMTADMLKAIAKANGIAVKGLREKNLRIAVRAAMNAKGAAPEAAAPTAPPTAHAKQPDLPHMQPGALQQLTEAVTTSERPRKRPRFTALVNTAPMKTQGLVLTLTEAFEQVFDTVCDANGVEDWRNLPGNPRPVVLAAATLFLDGADGWDNSNLEGAVILLRTSTDEGSLLHDLLLERALEVYGA